MPNITLSVEEETIKRVRKIAVDKNTTLTAMVREFLQSVADGDLPAKRQTIAALGRSFAELSQDMGPRTWTRDDLHDR